jgi:hypothetical protein
MGKDRSKFVIIIKIFVLLAYLIYFFLSKTNLINVQIYNPYVKPDTELKGELLSRSCLLLLGGSNVRMGLAAEAASNKWCQALNLGIESEGGGFKRYVNWLYHHTLCDYVIYSPVIIWSDKQSVNNSEEEETIFPKNSIFSFIKSTFLSSAGNDVPPRFNRFGDQLKYECLDKFPSFHITPKNFINSNYLIDQEINKLLLDVHEKTFNILKKTKDLMVDCSVILKKTNILKPDDIENIINSKYPYIWDFIKKNDG